MNQTEVGTETGVFAVKNGAMLGGIASAIGYVLLIIWTVVNHDRISEPGPIIATGVFGCILGLLVLGVLARLEHHARLIAVGVIGLALLLLRLLANPQIGLLGDSAVMFGAGNPALGLGFALAVFTMACFVPRRDAPDNNALRYTLLGLGITGVLLYLVIILTALAEGGQTSRGLGAVFGSGDPALIIFACLVLLGLVGLLVVGMMAGARHVSVHSVCQWGVALGMLVFYFTIGYIFVDFFIQLMKEPEGAAKLILDLLGTLVTGAGTLFGPSLICIATVGRIVGLLPHWQPWGLVQPLAAEKLATGAASYPTKATASKRSSPLLAVAANAGNLESLLKTLKDLHDQGLITQQEYDEKRAEILRRF